MPNLEALDLLRAMVSNWFPLQNLDGPNVHTKLLSSLRQLYLQNAGMGLYRDWSSLVRYMTHQTSGNHLLSLIVVDEHAHVCSEAAEGVDGLVRELVIVMPGAPFVNAVKWNCRGIGCIYILWFAAGSISVGLWPFWDVRVKTKTKG